MSESARDAVARLDSAVLDGLHGRSMLLTRDWNDAEIEATCRLVEAFEALDRAGVRTPLFPHELNYAVFFDQSTRTKSSWAGASARLGAHPVIVDGSSTQVSHGETAEETGAMLGMNSHALGIRHDLILGEGNTFMADSLKGITDYLRATDDERVVPLVNLQCDIDHPTQAMADLCWLRERFPQGLAGRKIAISWAYSPSYAKPLSVPQGLITLLTRFGADIRLAHPPGYDLLPDCVEAAERQSAASGGSFTRTASMDEAFADAEVVYPKSWGPFDLMTERVAANRARDVDALARIERSCLERNAQFTDWICDERRMSLTAGADALYMHCLPADIGAEVSHAVLDKARVDLAREANKKVFVIMALLAAAKSRDVKGQLQGLLDA